MADKPTQLDKFQKLARELEADEDEAHWDERLKKVAEAKRQEAYVDAKVSLTAEQGSGAV